jgi:uncharacterized LabA/DUF88 family protein
MADETPQVALFIDVDNWFISAQDSGLPFSLDYLIGRVRQEGTLMSAKAYADWTNTRLRPIIPDFHKSAIEQVQLSTTGYANEKNTADIQLAVDAMEMILSPMRPSVVIIVGGDRDYVPLVQKLKRYGAWVVGIGVEGSISAVLPQACNAFVYYDDLVPPSPDDEEQVPIPVDYQPTFSLMRRAIEAMVREGRQPLGATVMPMMKQMDPTFDLTRYRVSFKELALRAREAGYVQLEERTGTDFLLALPSNASKQEVLTAPSRQYEFSSPAAALASYRTILQEQRIPLLPWSQRLAFLTKLWEEARTRGQMSMDTMRQVLGEYAEQEGMRVSPTTITKLLYTLNFARCFSLDGNSSAFIQVPGQVNTPIRLIGSLDQTCRQVHKSYLNILLRVDATLVPEAIAELLFDNPDSQVKHRAEVDRMCSELQPPTPMRQALQAAIRQRGDH